MVSHKRRERGVYVVAGSTVFYSRVALLAATNAFWNMQMNRGDVEEERTCQDAYTGTKEVSLQACRATAEFFYAPLSLSLFPN